MKELALNQAKPSLDVIDLEFYVDNSIFIDQVELDVIGLQKHFFFGEDRRIGFKKTKSSSLVTELIWNEKIIELENKRKGRNQDEDGRKFCLGK